VEEEEKDEHLSLLLRSLSEGLFFPWELDLYNNSTAVYVVGGSV
jgi:hypothetical protein